MTFASTRTFVTTVAAALLWAAGAGSAVAQDPLKVGFVYVSPIGDAGWTSHDAVRCLAGDGVGGELEGAARRLVSQVNGNHHGNA